MRFGEVIAQVGAGRMLAAAVVLVALAAVGVRAVGWTDDFVVRSEPLGVELAAESSGAESTTTATASDGVNSRESGTVVVVHVAGAVLRPGVYELPGSSRIVDAVEAAGGPSAAADSSAVNFAALLDDSMQVYIPTRAEVANGWGLESGVPSGSPAPGGEAGSAGGPVNLNTAGVAELDTLPGIGQVTAGKIVADRAANGPFRSVDDLGRISGIGDAKIGALEGLAVAR